jgi:hypothetical protein
MAKLEDIRIGMIVKSNSKSICNVQGIVEHIGYRDGINDGHEESIWSKWGDPKEKKLTYLHVDLVDIVIEDWDI